MYKSSNKFIYRWRHNVALRSDVTDEHLIIIEQPERFLKSLGISMQWLTLVELELGIQLICISPVIPFIVNIIGNICRADLDPSGILLEMAGTWNTTDMQYGCISNSNSIEKLGN